MRGDTGAILNYVFALEAFINQVLADFAIVPKPVLENVDRLALTDKWALAPMLCGHSELCRPYDPGGEPIQSFRELVDIRNAWAHPKQKVRPIREGTQPDPEIVVAEYEAYLEFGVCIPRRIFRTFQRP